MRTHVRCQWMAGPLAALALGGALRAGDPIKVDAALDLVPPDALSFMLVADPKGASDDIAQCLARMDRPEVTMMGRPIDMLKAQAGIGAGFDDRGPVVAWWQASPAGVDAPPVPVVIVATTDPAQFLEANFTPAKDVGDDAWRRDGIVIHARVADRLVVMSPDAAPVRDWKASPGFAARLRSRLGDRAIPLIHGAEFVAWAGPEALASMREQSRMAMEAQAGDRADDLRRMTQVAEGMTDAMVAVDVDPLGLSIRTLSVFDPASRMGQLTRGGTVPAEARGAGVDRLPGAPNYLAIAIDLRGLGGGGPFLELMQLLGADAMVPGWMAEHRDLVDRVQVALYPSRLGLAQGLLNDSAVFVETKDPERTKALWRQWIESLGGRDGGITRSAKWEESRALRGGGEVSAFEVTEEEVAAGDDAGGNAAMMRMGKQLVIGPRGFIGFVRVVPGGLVMTFSQRTDVLGRAVEAAGGSKTLAQQGTVRALRRWLVPDADVEGFVGVGPIIRMASAAAASFGVASAVIEVPENLEPVAFAMSVQEGRVETAAMVPTGVLAIIWDQAKARLLGATVRGDGDGPAASEAPAGDGNRPRAGDSP